MRYRYEAKLRQRDMAQLLDCSPMTYGKWERDIVIPAAQYCPKIVEILGCLPGENTSTYSGSLQAQRLRLGMDRTALGKEIGIAPGIISYWEKGVYPPDIQYREALNRLGIDLSSFNLSRDGIPTSLAQRLLDARRHKKLSQHDVAKAVGLSGAPAWLRYELHSIVPPKRLWLRIEKVLGVDVSDLVPPELSELTQ